jgi:hypothetical protein
MKLQRFNDNLCSRREVSCFVNGCEWVSHKHVMVMISFIRKPEEGKEEVRRMTSYLHPWAHQILTITWVAHPWPPCNALQSNAKCVVYSGSPLFLYIPYTGISKWCLDWPRSRYSDYDSSCDSSSPPLVITFTRRASPEPCWLVIDFQAGYQTWSLNNLPVGYWFVL